MKPTSKSIAAQIANLDETVRAFQSQADGLALDAVTGNSEAATELAKLNARIAAGGADRVVLVAAQRKAAALEREASEDAADAERAEHRALARSHAASLVAAASSVDDAIAAYVSALALLGQEQTAVRQHVRLAGDDLGSRTGRHGAEAHATFLLARLADGTAIRRQDRTMAAFVAQAWFEYLPEATNSQKETA